MWFVHSLAGFRSRPLPNVSNSNNNNNTENNGSNGGSNRSSPARIEGKGVLDSMISVLYCGKWDVKSACFSELLIVVNLGVKTDFY